jgi:asparagine synthase (glutamine-hydrolysing)
LNNILYRFSVNSTGLAEPVLSDQGLHIEQSGTTLDVEVPFASTEHFFFRKTVNGFLVSSDLRLLYEKDDTVDTAGLTSLFLLGATVPPITPYKEIRSFIPGFKYSINLSSLEFTSEPSEKWSSLHDKDKDRNIEEQADIVSGVLDKAIKTACPSHDPIVLFSGGVDSGLIAARIASMGWEKATLMHCSFGHEDEETLFAKKIASGLGIDLDISTWDIDQGYESLTKAATLYSQPFCDHSCVPTHSLSIALSSKYKMGRVVLDGTGADGCFGRFGKAKKIRDLYRIPSFFRRILGVPYGIFDLWRNKNIFEHYSKLLQRSVPLSILPFSVAQNSLAGIGFYAPLHEISSVSSCCDEWIFPVARSENPEEVVPLIDIGLVCAGIYAQKNNSPLKQLGFFPEYPFLDKEVIDLAMSHARFWPENEIAKNSLSHLLTRKISPEYVYRKKRGFTAPESEQFSHPTFLEYLEAVNDIHAPLSGLVNSVLIKKLIKDLIQKRPLPSQTYNFIWAVTFTNAWLSQVSEISGVLKGKA